MKKWLIILLFPISSSAGWFGPSTFEECLLDNMKGVTSNDAALAIAFACRSQFPLPKPPPAPLLTDEERERQKRDQAQEKDRQEQQDRIRKKQMDALESLIDNLAKPSPPPTAPPSPARAKSLQWWETP